MVTCSIRPYRSGDADSFSPIFQSAVRQIGGRDYDPAQIAAWAARAPAAARWREIMGDGRCCLVAVDAADRPLAFGDMEADGHIDFLYAHPDAAGSCVVAALYAELEATARAQGLTRLYVEASEAARRFFLKQDFCVQQRRDFEIDGVAIHNYAMEKTL